MTFAGYESPIPVILNCITLERFPAQRERKIYVYDFIELAQNILCPQITLKNRIYLAKFT